MRTELFVNEDMGQLVSIAGSDGKLGRWDHFAFVPTPLPDAMPPLNGETFLEIADARAALAALDSTARRLPNPTLLRTPALRREAQSTSALEGTYAPLSEVLTADEENPSTPELMEIFNYVAMANAGFDWIGAGRAVTVSMLEELQGILMRGAPLAPQSGLLRDRQVVIGRRPDASVGAMPVHAAKFVPPPPGDQLKTGVQDLVEWWMRDRSSSMDPVVSAAMAHYQFETLHPFRDGNGRLGRYLIVLQLLQSGVLSEPTLTVSPWFEARRGDYYDALFAVSARGAWDDFVEFFARGLNEAAQQTHDQMLELVGVQEGLKDRIRDSRLRSDSAHGVVDIAIARPSFTVRQVQHDLGVSYPRASTLVNNLVELEILQPVNPEVMYKKRYFAPEVLRVLAGP